VALKACSLAAQGLWMRMLCIAAQHDPIGYVAVNCVGLSPESVARMAGAGVDEVRSLMDELSQNGVFSRDRNGTVYNRRMIRDAKKAAISKKNGKLGGNPNLCKTKEILHQDIREDNARLINEDKLKPIPIPDYKKKNTKKDFDQDFQKFWDSYGHKVDRPRAEKALEKALSKTTIEQILVGIKRYRNGLNDLKFIKDPAAWLNGERWSDEPASAAAINGMLAKEPATAGVRPNGQFYAIRDSPQWQAWASYRNKKSFPNDPGGGWYFPTEWPPKLEHPQ
jgi:hypothetical protein